MLKLFAIRYGVKDGPSSAFVLEATDSLDAKQKVLKYLRDIDIDTDDVVLTSNYIGVVDELYIFELQDITIMNFNKEG